VGLRTRQDVVETRLLFLPGTEPRFVRRPARCDIVCTIRTVEQRVSPARTAQQHQSSPRTPHEARDILDGRFHWLRRCSIAILMSLQPIVKTS